MFNAISATKNKNTRDIQKHPGIVQVREPRYIKLTCCSQSPENSKRGILIFPTRPSQCFQIADSSAANLLRMSTKLGPSKLEGLHLPLKLLHVFWTPNRNKGLCPTRQQMDTYGCKALIARQTTFNEHTTLPQSKRNTQAEKLLDIPLPIGREAATLQQKNQTIDYHRFDSIYLLGIAA